MVQVTRSSYHKAAAAQFERVSLDKGDAWHWLSQMLLVDLRLPQIYHAATWGSQLRQESHGDHRFDHTILKYNDKHMMFHRLLSKLRLNLYSLQPGLMLCVYSLWEDVRGANLASGRASTVKDAMLCGHSLHYA